MFQQQLDSSLLLIAEGDEGAKMLCWNVLRDAPEVVNIAIYRIRGFLANNP